MAIKTSDLTTFDVPDESKVIDMADKIYLLRPSATPLTVITGRTNKRPTTQREFKWLEEAEGAISTQINNGAGYNNSATSIVVDDGAVFRPNDLAYLPATKETVLVTAISTNTLTVTRGWGTLDGVGGVAAAAITDNDYIYNVGQALKENSDLPEQRINVEAAITNYTQIFRQPFGVSRSEKAINEYGGDRLAHLRLTQGIDFARKLEWAFLFGAKDSTTVGGATVQSTEGIFARVTSKVEDLADSVTYGGFESALESGFEYGADTKLFVVGRSLYTLLNQVAGNRLEISSPSEKTFGLRIMTWHAAHGDVNIVPHPMLTGPLATHGVLLDVNELAIRPLVGNGENRDVKLEKDKQSPGKDGYIEEYIAEVGFEVRQEKKHCIIKSDTDATASKDANF